ncbi:hypothetical protein [Agrobacterium pusense]|uniref:phage adaptor protein n=1 Tax=Agrobacterium pusense TaxID=648995 RepID=UPI000D1B7311|nr:hypothetical protein [Agrobacterium pusense]
MTIIVETTGPIDSIPTVISSGAKTFSNLVTQIADEIDDTTGEYAGQIQTAIFEAIRFCERDYYYFNETRDVSFSTVNGREWYDGTDNSNIPTLGRIVAAYVEHPDGRRSYMNRATPEELELFSDNSASRGEPYAYTYFGQRMRIYPIPDTQTYTIRLQLGPYKLAPVTSPSDSNVWTTEGFDMIKARAKYLIYKNIMKDAALAAEALNDYNDQNTALKAETSRRNGSGFIKVTCF